MPVTVPLYLFVQVPGGTDLWPGEFTALVKKCEENVEDRLPFGVTADWCDEHSEPELAGAFRWLANRPAVQIQKNGRYPLNDAWYTLVDPPAALGSVSSTMGSGFIGLIVALARRLTAMREALS